MNLKKEILLRSVDVPLHRSFVGLGRPVIAPFQITFAVTYRCLNLCQTCHSFRKSKIKEMTASEYSLLFDKMNFSPFCIVFTGGEPFLRNDFGKIVALACKKIKPSLVIIETSGDQPVRAKKILQTLAGYYKDTHFHIWLSLDGVKKQLDAMRGGAPHSFETLLRTYQNLRQISFTNFTVGFQVLISKFNINTAPQLIEDVFMLYPDIVSLDVAFGSDALDVIALNVTPEYERVTEIIKMYLDRLRKLRGPASIRFLKQYLMRRTGIISRNLKYGERVGKCFAGHASLYVDPAGSVKDCPVAGRELGDLSECEYDIERILKSATAKKVREQVNVSGCFCTMSSPSLSNVFLSPSEYLGIACSTL